MVLGFGGIKSVLRLLFQTAAGLVASWKLPLVQGTDRQKLVKCLVSSNNSESLWILKSVQIQHKKLAHQAGHQMDASLAVVKATSFAQGKQSQKKKAKELGLRAWETKITPRRWARRIKRSTKVWLYSFALVTHFFIKYKILQQLLKPIFLSCQERAPC